MTGLTADIGSLQVKLTLDGKAPASPQDAFRRNLSQVEVHLPPDTMGDLGIALTAQRMDGCTTLAGELHVPISGPGGYSVTIPLATSQGCALRVQKLGDGSVQVALSGGTRWHFAAPLPPDKLCPVTSLVTEEKVMTFPFGTKVKVLPSITDQDRGSYIGIIDGCDQSATGCEVEIGAHTRTVQINVDRDSVCSSSGFCWEHPRPQGQTLRKVRGTDRRNLWAVGDGTTLHYAGTYFSSPRRVRVPTPLSGIVPGGLNNVVTVGDAGTVLRLLNNEWSCPESLGSLRLNDAWGRSTDDFWVVGSEGTLLHWTGQAFQAAAIPALAGAELRAIQGRTDSGEIWAVGDRGTVLHYDGNDWKLVAFPSSETLHGVWPIPDGGAWVVGNQGIVGRIEGTQARLVATGVTTRLRTVFQASLVEAWVAGDGGVLLRFDGRAFSTAHSGTQHDLYSLWGADSTDIWAVGSAGTVLRYNGVYWTASSSSHSAHTLLAVAGTSGLQPQSPASAYAVGEQGTVLRYSGADWVTDAPFGLLAPRTLHAVTAPSPTEVWLAGSGGTILKWDGVRVVGGGTGTVVDLFGVWAGGGVVVAVGAAGALVQGNGTTWTATALPAAGGRTLRALWGSSATALWIVGDGGTILFWNGVSAVSAPSGVADNLRAIWGAGTQDIWAVGDSGRILHFDGSTWSLHGQGSSLTAKALLSLSGSSAAQIYAVGESGTMLSFDGSTWTLLDSGSIGTLTGIAVLPDGDVLAVGQGATILRSRQQNRQSQ
ncbi:MAG: hypothetical protein JNJ46_25520 [Myxococcales bacterium]|nr:hypothetical protein [Myxococcales bacterium]